MNNITSSISPIFAAGAKSIFDTATNNNTNKSTVPSFTLSGRLPVVQFEYPDSVTGKMKVRYLHLTEADADYIKGYELDHPSSRKDGQFKTFSRNRLVQNGVALISF